MCVSCWVSSGHPMVYNDRVAHATTMVDALYELAPTGGPLHVVVDDWNVEDGDLDVYQQYRPDGSRCYSAEVMERAVRLAEVLRGMGEAERLSALAHQDGILAEGRPTTVGTAYLETHRLNLAEVDPDDRPCTCLPAEGRPV